MKKVLITILLISLIVSTMSGLTMVANAENAYSVSIDDDNRIIVSGDTADSVCFVAQYDKDMKLISIDYNYLYSFMPDINENASYIKGFLWDDMEDMNNLAAPVTKELDFTERLTVEFSDIKEVTVGSARTNIKYWTDKDNNKSNTIRIKKDAAYAINGENNSSYNNDLLAKLVNQGYLTSSVCEAQIDFYCTDPSDAYDYDSVKITIYEDFLVDSYDSLSGKIYANLDSASILPYIDMYSVDYITTIKDIYGNTVDPSQLEEYDVLSLRIAPYDWISMSDITNIDATLSRNTVTGSVTEINSVDNEVHINGKPYTINYMSVYTPFLDDDGTFYLDFNGDIVAYDRTSSKNHNYAVIINAATTSGVDTRYQVKMYTGDGKLEVRELADKVKVSVYKGSYTTTSSCDDVTAFNMIPTFPAVCAYKLDSVGDISWLSFSTSEFKVTESAAMSAALVANGLNESGSVTGGASAVIKADSTYNLTQATKIIVMSSSVEPKSASREDFCTYSYSEFAAEKTDIASVSIYDTDEDGNAGFVFIYDESLVKEYVGDEVVIESGYGVILNAAQTSGVDDLYQVKMYTDKGNLVVYNLASKVQRPWYDGASTSKEFYTDDVIYNRLSAFPVICKYKLNEYREICSIAFGGEHCYGSVESDALITNEIKEAGSVTGGTSPVIKTDKAYNLTKDTKIIVMDPTVESKSASREDLSAYNYNEFNAEETDIASVNIYDADEDGNAGFVFICDESFVKEYVGDEVVVESGYGVIIDAARTSCVDDLYQIKMYTDKGNLVVYNLASKVQMPWYDGASTSKEFYTDDVIYDRLSTFPVICKYKLNACREICNIAFGSEHCYGSVESDALITNSYDESGKFEIEGQEVKRVNAGNTFYMNKNTKIIAMESGTILKNANKDNFRVYTADDFTIDQGFNSISVYDADASNYASLIFIYSNDITLSSNEINVIMVKSVNDVNNAEGDATMKVSGYNKDGAASAIFDADAAYVLEAGEVIFPKSFNSDGEIKKLVQVTENNNGTFMLTQDFINAYKAMLADDSDSTFYFGKVDYKQKNTIYFTNLLAEQGGSFVAKEESLIVPDTTPVLVYDASRASSNRVTYESAAYMSFATKPDENGKYPIIDENIGSYFILARELNGVIQDVVYYCYTTDVAPQTIIY